VDNDIKPLKKRVLVSDMHFGETTTAGGIILTDDDGSESGIHPRWAKVYAIGDQQDDVKVGQWVMVAHGRWSRGFKVRREGTELEVRMIDENDILLVSDDEPEQNRSKAGYVNTGGMKQMTSLPGND
jgi:co-chaperonin GroES (HSP10)